MAGRTTVPDSARTNGTLLRTVASWLTAGGEGGAVAVGTLRVAAAADDAALQEARDLVRLDAEQRAHAIDDRLADARHTQVVALCG